MVDDHDQSLKAFGEGQVVLSGQQVGARKLNSVMMSVARPDPLGYGVAARPRAYMRAGLVMRPLASTSSALMRAAVT